MRGSGTEYAKSLSPSIFQVQPISIRIALVLAAPLLGSCSGLQSALDPAGEEADQVANLFWVMTAGAAVIWAAVVALSLYASRWKRNIVSEQSAAKLIPWAGVAFPVVVLLGLLSYAVWLMPSLRPLAAKQNSDLRIEVVGNQFWWHVAYQLTDGGKVVSANEVRLPVGQRVEFTLASADMIHSFWIPPLGGKMDMIPGRTNRLSLLATKPGIYRGQCAEFCGLSHARMAFTAVAMEAADFDAWLAARASPSIGIRPGHKGADVFVKARCSECHRIDGTTARGTAGPDLSHIGSRLSLGAGLLENDVEAMARFIAHSGSLKPGSQMPAYLSLSTTELAELSAWLKGLE